MILWQVLHCYTHTIYRIVTKYIVISDDEWNYICCPRHSFISACILCFIFPADWVKYILPEAHFHLPSISPSQLVSYPANWSHYSTNCTVCQIYAILITNEGDILDIHTVPLLQGIIYSIVLDAVFKFVWHLSLFRMWRFCLTSAYFFVHPIPDNIMHTLQTLSVNEWGHSAGCLGKFVTSVIYAWSTTRFIRIIIVIYCIFK